MERQVDGEQLWRLTLQHSPVGMSLASPDGRLVAANDALCEMLGYSAEELTARTFQEITHPDDLAADLALLEETLSGRRTSYRMTKRYLHADGHDVSVDLSVALLRDDDGSPIHFIGQIIDLTAEYDVHAQLATTQAMLDEQRRRAEAVYEAVDVGLLLIDAEGRYVRGNQRHADMVKLAFPQGHLGRAGQTGEIFGEDGVTPMVPEEMPSYRASRGEEFADVRLWIGSDPLTRVALSCSARSVRDADGRLVGAALAYKDVTAYLRALEVKNEFVASVSHELRTPLTAVLGHLELLVDAPGLPAPIARRLEVVERNAIRLRHLVSDLLHVAQEPEGGLSIVRSDCDLVAIVVEAVEAVRPSADASGLTLDVDVPEVLTAMVDPGRFRQVVDNLVSNGIKYSRDGGAVRVGLAVVGDSVELTIADAGMGVEAEDLDRLFTRFFRGSQAQELHIPGTGLGLNIVRSIVEAHGGEVALTSEVGVGSTVVVRLPHVSDATDRSL